MDLEKDGESQIKFGTEEVNYKMSGLECGTVCCRAYALLLLSTLFVCVVVHVTHTYIDSCSLYSEYYTHG